MPLSSSFRHLRHWRRTLVKGPGGLGRLLPIAIPMVISQLFDTVMMFVDRLFLSYLSPLAMASCMTGGLTAFLCGYIAFGLVSYASTLVAHRYGAARFDECGGVVMQGVWIGVAAYPIVLLVGRVAVNTFAWAGHTPEQVALESAYFRIMILAIIIGLLRTAFSSFFAGIGRTKVIMLGNAISLVVNIFGNYVLIFGKWGFPALGIVGAALGTVIANAVMMLIMAAAFFLHVRRKPFHGKPLLRLNLPVCRQLIRYGLPSGLGGFASTGGFTLIVLMLHAMGEHVAAAVTMFYNWELLSFFPLLGVQIAVSTLVGQNMGAHSVRGARQTVRSGLALVICYTSLITLLFVALPRTLLEVFGQGATTDIIDLAVPMMRFGAIYLTFDGMSLIVSGALRGAGDTLWTMIIGTVFHLVLVTVTALAIHVFHASPLNVWKAICVTVFTGVIAYFARYWQGHWQKMRI